MQTRPLTPAPLREPRREVDPHLTGLCTLWQREQSQNSTCATPNLVPFSVIVQITHPVPRKMTMWYDSKFAALSSVWPATRPALWWHLGDEVRGKSRRMRLQKTCLPYLVIVAMVMSIYSVCLLHLTKSFGSPPQSNKVRLAWGELWRGSEVGRRAGGAAGWPHDCSVLRLCVGASVHRCSHSCIFAALLQYYISSPFFGVFSFDKLEN